MILKQIRISIVGTSPITWPGLFAENCVSSDGWAGVSSLRLDGKLRDTYQLSTGKKIGRWSLGIWPADGYDRKHRWELVRIAGKSKKEKVPIRTESGLSRIEHKLAWCDWKACVSVAYDADLITEQTVVRLMESVGRETGLGDGKFRVATQ